MGPAMTRMFLAVDPLLSAAAVLINFIFILLVLVRTSRSIVFMLFLFTCSAVMLWNLGDFMVYLTGRRYWFYFSLIGTGLIPAFMFHFIATLAHPHRESPTLITPAYVFSGLLAISAPLAIISPRIQPFVDGFAWNICYFAVLAPVLFYCINALFSAIRSSTNDDDKNRLRYVLLAIAIGVLAGTTDLVQVWGVSIPPLGHLGSVFYSSILAIGVFRHRSAYDILAQTRRKLEVMNEMAAGVAHEIRNPLSSIKGAAELASDDLSEGNIPKSREYLDIIAEEVERLDNILTNFQYYSKPLRLDRKTVSVNEVIQKTVRLTGMGAQKISISGNLSERLPAVQADASLLKQVFLNVIKNAAEACGQGGDMTITTEHVPPHVKISFSDNGPGMPPEVMSHIFEPFFTTKTSGTGMGMAICQRIVSAHGGRIEVENITPHGTRFSILLPVKE